MSSSASSSDGAPDVPGRAGPDVRLIGAALAGFGAFVLGAALVAEHLVGLEPCPLCLYQRLPPAVIGALGVALWLAGMVGRAGTAAVAVLGGLALVAALAGAGLGGYHVGVEQGWWEAPAACEAVGAVADVAALRAELLGDGGTGVVPCDEPAWTFAGISMAGYNVLLSLGLAAWLTKTLATLR